MKRMSAFLIGLMFLVTAGSASASTMNFTSGGPNATLIEFNNFDGTGIDIDVTASWDGKNKPNNIATVHWNTTGLGVKVNDNDHPTIDGKVYNDFLFFTFSQDVTLTDVGFGAATKNDEFDLFVDKTRVLKNQETTPSIISLGVDGFIGTEFAFRATEDDDNFRVASLSFEITEPGSGANPTPEPTTMVLFGFGLLSVAGITRRKRQA